MVPSDCGSAPAIEDIGLTIPSNLVVVPGIKSGGAKASAGFGLVVLLWVDGYQPSRTRPFRSV